MNIELREKEEDHLE